MEKKEFTGEVALEITKDTVRSFAEIMSLVAESALTKQPIDPNEPRVVKAMLLMKRMTNIAKEFDPPAGLRESEAAQRAQAQREEKL